MLLVGCYTNAAPQPAPAPTTAAKPSAASSTVLDEGRFEALNSPAVEQFSITRTDEGWRFAIDFKHPAASVKGEMVTDASFHPLHGELVQTSDTASPIILRLRTEKGLLVSEAQAQGKPAEVMKRATQSADWYIGGAINAFLTPVCQYEGGAARPIVFPDTVVEMSAAAPLTVDGLNRSVVVRHIVYPNKHDLVVACEHGRLVGNRDAKGSVSVRAGDAAVGRALTDLK
jgi:hypothetical protein